MKYPLHKAISKSNLSPELKTKFVEMVYDHVKFFSIADKTSLLNGDAETIHKLERRAFDHWLYFLGDVAQTNTHQLTVRLQSDWSEAAKEKTRHALQKDSTSVEKALQIIEQVYPDHKPAEKSTNGFFAMRTELLKQLGAN